jgi:hypothetical protein
MNCLLKEQTLNHIKNVCEYLVRDALSEHLLLNKSITFTVSSGFNQCLISDKVAKKYQIQFDRVVFLDTRNKRLLLEFICCDELQNFLELLDVSLSFSFVGENRFESDFIELNSLDDICDLNRFQLNFNPQDINLDSLSQIADYLDRLKVKSFFTNSAFL